MRIALYHNLPSGGAKRVVMETIRRLSQRHHIDEFCPETANRAFCDIGPWVGESVVFPYRRHRSFGPPFGRLNSALRLADLYRMRALGRIAADIVDRRGYDVVLAHPCQVTQAPSILPFLRTPSIYYCQEPARALYEPPIQRPYLRDTALRRTGNRIDLLRWAHRSAWRASDRKNLRAAKLVLANSAFTQQAVRRIYAAESRLNRPAVDPELFRPSNGAKSGFVLSVGALQPEKGFDFVITSLARIEAQRRPPLVIVSNFALPDEGAYLEWLAEREHVDVTLQVGISNDELVQTYDAALLTAYAPIREPLGLVALESQACRTPVVGVAEGGVAETVVHESTGLLVERDPGAFASAVNGLLANKPRREEYGRQGREHVERHWNWEQSVAELEEALVMVTGGAAESRRAGSTTAVRHESN